MPDTTKEAEQHFGKPLRAPKTFRAKVDTDYTRLMRQRRMNNFGMGFMVMFIIVFGIAIFLECLRVI